MVSNTTAGAILINRRWLGTTTQRAIPVPKYAAQIGSLEGALGTTSMRAISVPNLTSIIDILKGALGTTGSFSFFVPSISA